MVVGSVRHAVVIVIAVVLHPAAAALAPAAIGLFPGRGAE
jgi:hypothetical protein